MKISVAMCTYNGEKFLREQIDSILIQSQKVDEIIVCDDGSTDATIAILKEYAKNNIGLFKIFENEINLRSVKNFEKAIGLCTGDIIFLSDQDDVWMPNKVAKYAAYFEKNKSIKAIASNGNYIDELSVIHQKYAVWDGPEFLKEKGVTFNYFDLISKVGNLATGASMAFKKEILPKILPFPIINNFHHDEWIALMTAKDDEFVLLPEKYFSYRIHDNQQVGGVFFKKTNKVKKEIYQQYNIYEQDLNFNSLKRRIKYQINAYERNLLILEFFNFENELFKENLISIEKALYSTKAILKKKYPLKTFFMNMLDKILKKRQFKPYEF